MGLYHFEGLLGFYNSVKENHSEVVYNETRMEDETERYSFPNEKTSYEDTCEGLLVATSTVAKI